MTLKRTLYIALFLFFTGIGQALAQPAMTFTSISNADWGQFMNCSCTQSLLLTDSGSGVVSIDAAKNNTIVVTISYPTNLTEDGGTDTISYSTPKAAYNTGTNDKNTATPFSGDQSTETITVPATQGATTLVYIYIYGDLSVNFPNAGSYSGTITVNATYQ